MCVFKCRGVYTRHHTEKLLHTSHILDLLELLEIIVKGEGLIAHLLFELCCLFIIVSSFRFFDEGKHVAHTEDSACHTVGVEGLNSVYLFSDTNEFDGFAGNVSYRESGTASSVTVKLCKNYAGDIKKVVEMLCNVYRILTDHRVDGKKDFGRLDLFFDRTKFFHKHFVYMKTSCGINKYHIAEVVFGVFKTFLRNFYGRDIGSHCEYRNVYLFSENLQLLDSRRTVDVTSNEQWTFALLFVHCREFGGVCCFTCTLKTAHHYYGWGI